MAASIKRRIMERLGTILDPLKQEKAFERVEWKRDLMVLEQADKAIHLVAGNEQRVAEDTQGYTMEFLLAVKLTFKDWVEVLEKNEDLVRDVVEKLEGATVPNAQFSDADGVLVNWMTYEGNEEFIQDFNAPRGGVVLYYRLQYRRKRADATTSY